MTISTNLLFSFVVPLYNEAAGLLSFHDALVKTVREACGDDYEIIYCDDGSHDGSAELVHGFRTDDKRVKLISFSRNFGKENALTAGIHAAKGDAIITLDGDGQHPVTAIPRFIEVWRAGAQVVVGVRRQSASDTAFKRLGSQLFYTLFNALNKERLVPGATDFRLIDKTVQQAFRNLPEANRMTRSLIDWLGFRRVYVTFDAKPRLTGTAGYGTGRLISLAANSFVSLSPKPLYIFGYLGIGITLLSFLLGTAVFIEQILLGDPLSWDFTGTAMLSILLLFMVGIVLMSQGILSLYISHIHTQSKGRPLYVIDYGASAGIEHTPTSHGKS